LASVCLSGNYPFPSSGEEKLTSKEIKPINHQQRFKRNNTKIFDKPIKPTQTNLTYIKQFFLNNQPDAIIILIYSVMKLYMFRAFSKKSQDGTQFHPDSAWKRSSKICMKLTSAECTEENS
jgi:hypothetical protein